MVTKATKKRARGRAKAEVSARAQSGKRTQANARRVPRPDAKKPSGQSGPRVGRSKTEQIPPRAPRAKLRTLVRWGVRIGLAGGLACGLLFAAQEGYEYATTSPRFEVRGLVFEPTPHVSDERLRELMNIEPGTNILALDLDGLATKITAEPWVARASVVRVLPDGLEVEVHEHKPQAVMLAGGFYLVGADAMPFKPLDPSERQRLPVITGVGQSLMFTEPARARQRIRRGLEALELYAQKHRPRLSEVNIDETDAVTLYTSELGSQLRLGRGDIATGLARYDALRAALGEDSDKLAVAHLDASTNPDNGDRIVASFFPTQDAPGFVSEASQRADAKASEHAAAVAERNANKGKGRRSRGKKRSRLPRY